MKKLGSDGGAVATIILSLSLVITLFFAFWAFAGRQDYKNNVDQKIAAASAVVKQQTIQAEDQKNAEADKQPLKDFAGPSTYGSLDIKYPKTWSVYLDTGSDPINAYFQPDFVTDLQNTSFALRVDIVQSAYSDEMQQFSGSAASGTAKVTAYTAPKVPNVVGSRVEGAIANGKQGIMVLLPLRDKTIEVWTENAQYFSDFNNNILPNLTYSP